MTSQFFRNFPAIFRNFPAIFPQFFAIGFDPPRPQFPPPPWPRHIVTHGGAATLCRPFLQVDHSKAGDKNCAALGREPTLSIWRCGALTTRSLSISEMLRIKDHVQTAEIFFRKLLCDPPPPQGIRQVGGWVWGWVGGSAKIPGGPIYPPPPQYH